MTRQRALSPLTLLLASLLCYGFVLVWTQSVTHETTTAFEDLSAPSSPARVRILTGGNFSASVSPLEATTEPPVVSTLHGKSTTATPKITATNPAPTTKEYLPTTVPTGDAEGTTGDGSTLGSQWAPLSTTVNSSVKARTERQRGTTEVGVPRAGMTKMAGDTSGVTASSSVSDRTNSVPSGTTMADQSVGTTGTGTDVLTSRTMAALPRTAEKSSSLISPGGKMTWRVRLQSTATRARAVTAFYDQACNVVMKKLHLKDIYFTLGPGQVAMKCIS